MLHTETAELCWALVCTHLNWSVLGATCEMYPIPPLVLVTRRVRERPEQGRWLQDQCFSSFPRAGTVLQPCQGWSCIHMSSTWALLPEKATKVRAGKVINVSPFPTLSWCQQCFGVEVIDDRT